MTDDPVFRAAPWPAPERMTPDEVERLAQRAADGIAAAFWEVVRRVRLGS